MYCPNIDRHGKKLRRWHVFIILLNIVFIVGLYHVLRSAGITYDLNRSAFLLILGCTLGLQASSFFDGRLTVLRHLHRGH